MGWRPGADRAGLVVCRLGSNQTPGGYTMDHSAVIYLMGLDNKFITVIPYQEDDASAIAKLKNLAALTPTS